MSEFKEDLDYLTFAQLKEVIKEQREKIALLEKGFSQENARLFHESRNTPFWHFHSMGN